VVSPTSQTVDSVFIGAQDLDGIRLRLPYRSPVEELSVRGGIDPPDTVRHEHNRIQTPDPPTTPLRAFGRSRFGDVEPPSSVTPPAVFRAPRGQQTAAHFTSILPVRISRSQDPGQTPTASPDSQSNKLLSYLIVGVSVTSPALTVGEFPQ